MVAQLCAHALVEKDGKFLLVKAKVGVPKDLWNLPGGHVDENETFLEAAKREAKEETGLDIEIKNILCVAHEHLKQHTIIVTFRSSVLAGFILVPEDEIEEARWFSFSEINKIPKNQITHSAYNSILAFKKNKQLNYSTNKLTA